MKSIKDNSILLELKPGKIEDLCMGMFGFVINHINGLFFVHPDRLKSLHIYKYFERDNRLLILYPISIEYIRKIYMPDGATKEIYSLDIPVYGRYIVNGKLDIILVTRKSMVENEIINNQ